MALVTVSGGRVLPGQKLAAGGQGEIFAVASPTGFVFKGYLRRTLASDPALARRLRVMAGLDDQSGDDKTWSPPSGAERTPKPPGPVACAGPGGWVWLPDGAASFLIGAPR